MRNFFLLIPLLCLALPGRAQDEADAPAPPRALPAPEVQQDAEASREKLLKASDELDMIQSNAETTKVSVDAMKSDITQLQSANADLKQQLAALQTAFDKAEAERTRERQALVDEVAQLVASRTASDAIKASGRKHQVAFTPSDASSPTDSSFSAEVHHGNAENHVDDTPSNDSSPADDSPPPPRPQKGYYHVVESGETLTLICAAYRDQGVKVSLAQVRKANGLTSKSVLKVGQKLFIPKPGT